MPEMCCDNSIDLCVADAQYLSNMFKPQHQAAKYRGVKTRSRTLGIWAPCCFKKVNAGLRR